DRRERLVTLMPPPPGTATMKKHLSPLRLFAALALTLAAAQFRESGLPELAGHLELTVEQSDTGRATPARGDLFKQAKPFRLSPVDALLPLRVDLFYRERLWKRAERPRTLEVTHEGDSHFLLLDGTGSYDLPPGSYRVEAYRGFFFAPASTEFT